ncbi:hypothetical protein IH992_23795 [Candidatus Poribacteria bacterium]|nr:hypothetical protein [Candidatus Poribacteria bacterium]
MSNAKDTDNSPQPPCSTLPEEIELQAEPVEVIAISEDWYTVPKKPNPVLREEEESEDCDCGTCVECEDRESEIDELDFTKMPLFDENEITAIKGVCIVLNNILNEVIRELNELRRAECEKWD